MRGINFLTSAKSEKTAIVIDLKKDQVEDFLAGLEGASRTNEPSVDFEKAVAKIIKAKSNRGISRQNKKVG